MYIYIYIYICIYIYIYNNNKDFPGFRIPGGVDVVDAKLNHQISVQSHPYVAVTKCYYYYYYYYD